MFNNLRTPDGYAPRKQPGVDSSNINDSNGLRSRYTNRNNSVNERQQPVNSHQRVVNGCPVNGYRDEVKHNGHSNLTNGHPTFINGHALSSNRHSPVNRHEATITKQSNVKEHLRVNGHVAKHNGQSDYSNRYRNILNGCQNGLYINKMVANGWVSQRDDSSKQIGVNGLKSGSNDRVKGVAVAKENGNLEKNRQCVVDGKNGVNRLVVSQTAVNGRLGVKKEQGKDAFGIPADLRQLLKPTVIQKRPEIIKVDYDPEDINGPYNFRQLLRPAEYLPTESLRKRKGGLACNEVQASKDKVPEKHVKRRAPLAPNQNKLVNVKK